MKVTIYTDGAARGNPEGPGGYGCLLHYIDSTGKLHIREFSAGYKKTTNNRMEMLAVIVGLEALTRPCQVTVVSDSKYVTDAFNQHWLENWQKNQWKTSTKKPVKNKQLWLRMLKAMESHQVQFQWIKGHAGHPENERCDELATSAADGENLLEDNLGD
ncbi:MAG: ribonuclease HI [Lachnospiraceae bacterium]|nr:ribonuclease HI [Lachnospiraceae bacterium]